jgi:hypothetical protein
MGTDTGFAVTPYGEWHGRELQLLMDYAGLSALEAIKAATKNAAVTVNLDGLVGEIAAGKLADVIVVDGDPLMDISVLWMKSKIVTVIKDGKIVDFDDDVEHERHPHQRNLIYSLSDLTQDVVYGEGRQEREPSFAWSPELAREIGSELKAHELGDWTIADA